jgi:hypothetical protein
MNVYSELVKAQLENLASDPSSVAGAKGRIYHKSTTEPIKIDDGTTLHTVITDQNKGTHISQSFVRTQIDLPTFIPFPCMTIFQAAGCFESDLGAFGYPAGNYALGFSGASVSSASAPGNAMSVFYLDNSDYPTVNGKTPKLRVRATCMVNDVAPADSFTVGLFSVTRPASSGASNVNTITISSAMGGVFGPQFSFPAADSIASAQCTDIDFPADGHYCLGVALSIGGLAAGSFVTITAQLQVIYV